MTTSDDSTVFDLLGDSAPASKAPSAAPAPAAGDDSTVFNLLGGGDAGLGGPQAPAAPAGPPRLRGQALTPPAAPRPAGGAPAAPEDLSLGAVAAGAWKNAPASLWHNIQQTVSPLLPQNWQQDVQGVKALATDPKARAAVADMYKQRYGSAPGFLSTLKHDPFAIGSDVAALATIPAGGEGIAAKVPGVTGDVLGAVAKASKVAQLADPSYAAARVAGKVAGAGLKTATTPLGRRVIGDVVGGAIGSHLPLPAGLGMLAGAKAGEHVARTVLPKILPPGALPGMFAAGRTVAGALPAATALSGMQPDESQQPPGGTSPGGAPGSGPTSDEEPAPAPDPGAGADPRDRFRAMYPHFASGMTDDQVDALLQEPELKGLYDAKPAATAPTLSSGLQGAPLRAPRGAMFGHIAAVAGNAGASPTEVSTLQQIARIESGGNPDAASPSGRYHGLFQYPDGGDPTADTVRALGDLKKNEQRLTQMGVTPDAGALYVMHQQGAGGGPALLTAAPGTKAIDAISRFYGSRGIARQAIAHNLGINYRTPQGAAQANAAAENMTAADFVNLWRNKLTGVPFAEGGRVGFAEGGQVVDMTEQLLKRAAQAQRAAQASTRPLLGLSDDAVAKALKVAQAAI